MSGDTMNTEPKKNVEVEMREIVELINKYGCQKGVVYETWEHGELIGEPKLDGYRMHAVIDSAGKVLMTTRGHSEPYTTNLKHVADQIASFGLRNCILDGELVADGSWNATAVVRKTGALTHDDMSKLRRIMFYVFDWVAIDQIQMSPVGRKTAPVFPITQAERRLVLEDSLMVDAPNVMLLPQRRLRSAAEVEAFAEEMRRMGYEGAMLKVPHAPYVFTRGTSWLKVKPFRSVDAVITRFVEGGGKYKGTLGAIEVRDKEGTVFKLGTGFDDATRNALWADREKLVGTWVEAKVQEGEVAKARHPVFLRLRPEHDGDASSSDGAKAVVLEDEDESENAIDTEPKTQMEVSMENVVTEKVIQPTSTTPQAAPAKKAVPRFTEEEIKELAFALHRTYEVIGADLQDVRRASGETGPIPRAEIIEVVLDQCYGGFTHVQVRPELIEKWNRASDRQTMNIAKVAFPHKFYE